MMKKISLIRPLLALWLILFPSVGRSLELKFQENGIRDSVWEQKVADFAQSSWNGYDKKFSQKSDETLLVIQLAAPSEMKGHWARTGEQGIILSRQIPSKTFYQVLKHELAHAYLLKNCGNQLPMRHQLVHEAFAQWVSEDYLRLLENTPFIFAQDAHVWFLKNGWDDKKDSSKMEFALARLLSVADKSVMETYFKDLLQDCSSKDFKGRTWDGKLSEIFHFNADHAAKTSSVDFLLIDALSQKVLKSEGKTDEAFPIASTLKPLIVAMFPEFITSKKSRVDHSWDCPEVINSEANIRTWNWKEAMIKSCNGFFLDGQKVQWKKMNELIGKIGAKSDIKSMASAIGLIPGNAMNLRQMLKLYVWINASSPLIIDALKETAREGTLAHSSVSSWFYQRGIALKTGTQRDIKSRPENAWIIAVGPSFLAAIHAKGASTRYLLVELKKRLETLSLEGQPAAVKLFNLLPLNQITLTCGSEGPLMIKQGGGWTFSKNAIVEGKDFKEGSYYFCLGGPMHFSFPLKNKKKEIRPYYGVLEYRGSPQSKKQGFERTSFLQENQVRARNFSPYLLHTSERYYLWGVLAAEYPRGQMEVLKALSAIARHNLKYYQERGEAICDNTYCQVFGPRQDLPKKLSNKILTAVEDSLSFELHFPEGKRWLYFSLGGTKAWKTERKRDELEKVFQIQGIKNIFIQNHKIYMTSRTKDISFSCEVFRNQAKLLSCPDKITPLHNKWFFEGRGEGHGLGLDLINASTMAVQGKDKKQILKRFFPEGELH